MWSTRSFRPRAQRLRGLGARIYARRSRMQMAAFTPKGVLNRVRRSVTQRMRLGAIGCQVVASRIVSE